MERLKIEIVKISESKKEVEFETYVNGKKVENPMS